GGQFPRCSGARLAIRVQEAEKAADGSPVEGGGLEVVRANSPRCRHVPQELGQIAPIGATRMGRDVAAVQMLQKLVDVPGHRTASAAADIPRDTFHASSAASARSATASLRASLSRGGCGSGSMMPNVMFDGS